MSTSIQDRLDEVKRNCSEIVYNNTRQLFDSVCFKILPSVLFEKGAEHTATLEWMESKTKFCSVEFGDDSILIVTPTKYYSFESTDSSTMDSVIKIVLEHV